MRYQFTQTDKRYDGKLVYRSTLYPNIPVTDDDIYVTLSQDDYLDSIAKQYYGDESYWWIIAVANNISDGKLSVENNKQIRIPGNLPNILKTLQSLNQ